MTKKVFYGFAAASFLVACVSAGTLKAATQEAIEESDSTFQARGGGGGLGHGGHGLGGGLGGLGGGGGWNGNHGGGGAGLGWNGNEAFTGPSSIAFAFPIAIALIVALWIAAYNTLRSPPPKIGYAAGLVESAGSGWNQQGANAYISGGYGGGYEQAGSEHAASASTNLANSAVIQAASSAGNAGAVAVGRAIDSLTNRVVSALDSQEKKFF